ncbi:MAG: ribonuclease E/G [Pseudomonadota bacterium]
MTTLSPDTLLINAQPGERRFAWLRDGQLVDVEIWREGQGPEAGAVYLGRVQRIDRRLGAAFVEVGSGTAGFLPLRGTEASTLSEGRYLPVRVVRAATPQDGKGPKLSTRLGELSGHPAVERAISQGRDGAKPGLLSAGDNPIAGDDPVAAVLRHQGCQVLCDDEDLYHACRQAAFDAPSDQADGLTFYTEAEPLFEAFGVEAQIEALLGPQVDLPSGGGLLIEPTRTLTAIDVNAGQHREPGGPEALAAAVNREAVPAIARHLRLRGLSGLIVVDFLRLAAEDQRRTIVSQLRKALRHDPAASEVRAMSPTGLVEMSRQRRRPPLLEILTIPCGLGGSGRKYSSESNGFALLRQLRGQLAHTPGKGFRIKASRAIIEALESGQVAAARRQLETRLGRRLPMEASRDREEPEIIFS